MTIEALWYSSYIDGKAPHMRRLCRQPLDRQWTAAVELAIAYMSGHAGYRSTGRNSLTREETWYWPQPDGDWWLIPHRVDRRCIAIAEAATRCELHRGRGRASQDDIVARLRRWASTGHWRRFAHAIYPRHGRQSTYAALFREPKPRRGRRRS